MKSDLRATNTPTTRGTSAAFFGVTTVSAGQIVRLENLSGATVNDGLCIQNAGTLTNGIYFVGTMTYGLEFSGGTFSTADIHLKGGTDAILVTPGSDKDVNLIKVGVTGTPLFWWDEDKDQFVISKGVALGDAGSSSYGFSTADALGNVYFGGSFSIRAGYAISGMANISSDPNRGALDINIPVTAGSSNHQLSLQIDSNDVFYVVGTGDGAGGVTALGAVFVQSVSIADEKAINTGAIDDDYFTIGAVDNDNQNLIECIRLVGAAEPHALLTRAKWSTASHAADEGHRGFMYFTEGAGGVADKLYCIMKGADDNYTAIQVAIG